MQPFVASLPQSLNRDEGIPPWSCALKNLSDVVAFLVYSSVGSSDDTFHVGSWEESFVAGQRWPKVNVASTPTSNYFTQLQRFIKWIQHFGSAQHKAITVLQMSGCHKVNRFFLHEAPIPFRYKHRLQQVACELARQASMRLSVWSSTVITLALPIPTIWRLLCVMLIYHISITHISAVHEINSALTFVNSIDHSIIQYIPQ